MRGALVASQGKGQSWEVVADEDRASSARRTTRYPLAEKRTHSGVPARDRASAAALKSVSAASSAFAAAWPSPFTNFSRSAGLSTFTRRSSPEAIAKARANCFASPRSIAKTRRDRPDGEIDYAKDFFARSTYLTVSGQLEAEAFACCLIEGLHLWSHLPCRELEHFTAR